ncbi:MAG TPA: hypothetical protein VL598_15895 [Trinickia sp.]|uniref:hypothetical protein n=1 Tax=Trinickia sp. TaxID=2571163 RepID=UPI002CEC83A9|nr:hypothetical protein [Trinickia sp.]HTI19133.1 hypothetical protein [Trinickia sp.]
MKSSKLLLASLVGAVVLAGCVTTSGPVATGRAPQANQPMPYETYQPMPYDAYVATVADRDVVFVGGDTYIWVVGPDGVRHRQLYAHGDHRADIFHRREQLRAVMAHHGGHLPDHALVPERKQEMQTTGGPAHAHGTQLAASPAHGHEAQRSGPVHGKKPHRAGSSGHGPVAAHAHPAPIGRTPVVHAKAPVRPASTRTASARTASARSAPAARSGSKQANSGFTAAAAH